MFMQMVKFNLVETGLAVQANATAEVGSGHGCRAHWLMLLQRIIVAADVVVAREVSCGCIAG